MNQVTLKQLQMAVMNESGKKVGFSIVEDLYGELNHEDAKRIKDAFEDIGIKFVEAKHLRDNRYYMIFSHQGLRIDMSYTRKESIDDEIERLENKLIELKARKAENGEG